MEEKKEPVTKKSPTKKATTMSSTKATPKEVTRATAKEKKSSAKKVTTEKPKTTKKMAKTDKQNLAEPKNLKILGYNDLELNTYVYDNVENPKAVVVIVHGMQEHCLRYKAFAQYLNQNGFIVITNDLRGHGHTAISKDKLGFGEKDIFTETLQDELNIISYANETYNLPIYLFGHSYGSMLSQNLIQLSPLIEKCVLSGTGNGSSFVMKMGGLVASILSPFKKYDSKGGLIERLCIKSYGKGFKRGNWLTRDESIYDIFLQDEYCGGSFPFSFYKSLIKNMNKTNKTVQKIGSKKVFLIAGDCDPVGEKGKQVKKLYRLYLKNNINAKLKLYKGARHELINEINKEEVYKDVVDFFNE